MASYSKLDPMTCAIDLPQQSTLKPETYPMSSIYGHRHIESTMTYIHLTQGLINTSDEHVCKVAKNINEAAQLAE